MGTPHTVSAPPPALSVAGDRAPVANAYFAVTIDSAVDLLEARGYANLTRPERVSKARAEQQAFLAGFLDPSLHAALDLRVAVDPAASTPLSAALLGRVWGGSIPSVSARAEGLRGRVLAALPPHVTASCVEDAGAVARLLAPFPAGTVDSAVITRHELIGAPARPDAGVSYYYSAAPFAWSDDDWSGVYAALAASPVPLVLSVAVLPMLVPAPFAQTLRTLANFYGRLAAYGQAPGGYLGRQQLAADPFAVDAEKAFADFCRHLSHKAYALRIQLSAARKLPPGIAETVAAAIAPAVRPAAAAADQRPVPGYPVSAQPVPACDVRRPASVAERRLAEYNLNLVNFGLLTGQPEIWSRPDPPDPQLAMLPVLGDDRDACCAFRFPVAANGTVPGFPVRRGQPSPPGAGRKADGTVRLGKVHGTDRDLTLPLRSLTGHTLVTGSAGSGKSATAAGLLRQLWASHQVPFLVIGQTRSGVGRYRALAADPGFESLEVITVGDEDGRPLRFNPLGAPPGARVGEHAASLLACFTAAYGLSGPLPAIYQDALSLTYLRAGFLATERPTGGERAWPTMVDFRDALDEVTADPGYPGEAGAAVRASALRRASQLVRGVTGSAFLTSRPAGVGRLLSHPVILDLSPLGTGDEQALMTALLLNAVAGHRRAGPGGSAELAHVTLVDQAHPLLARTPGWPTPDGQARERAAAALAGTLLAAGRHGEGLVIADPAPARLAAELVKGTSLKIVHRLTAADDRRCLAEATAMDDAQRVLAARLPAGQALLYSDELPGPVRADVGPVPPEPAGAAEDLVAAGATGDEVAALAAEADEAAGAAGAAGAEVAAEVVGDGGGDEAGAGASLETVPLSAAAQFAASPPAATPFAACDRCRAQCAYRGAALSILDDPAAVAGIAGAAGAAADGSEDPGLAELRAQLYGTVDRFAALPAADPGRSDAAFCLFLHVHASTPLRLRPKWPDLAARMLGITAATGETGTAPGR
jgi:hypothetical protein